MAHRCSPFYVVYRSLKRLDEEEKHYIQWIELIADDRTYRQFLEPGDQPEVVFNVTADQLTAREYCNLHGLWKATA